MFIHIYLSCIHTPFMCLNETIIWCSGFLTSGCLLDKHALILVDMWMAEFDEWRGESNVELCIIEYTEWYKNLFTICMLISFFFHYFAIRQWEKEMWNMGSRRSIFFYAFWYEVQLSQCAKQDLYNYIMCKSILNFVNKVFF